MRKTGVISAGTCRSLFLVAAACCLFTKIPAQSVCGTVEYNLRPVSGAEVSLPSLKQTTSTDSTGSFCFRAGTDKLLRVRVRAEGYMDFETTLKADDSTHRFNVIELESLSEELQEVTISSTMREVMRKESPIPVEVFSPAFFRKNPSSQIFESVQMINGIQPQINCSVCNTGDIHINGMEGPYTMVTIDGMPIVSSLSTVYGLMGIPNSLIERMEVIRGASSTLYGSEAMAGVINIITRNPVIAPHSELGFFVTSDQEYNLDLMSVNRLGKTKLLTGINAYYFENPFDRNGDGFTDISQQKRVSLFQKIMLPNASGKRNQVAYRFFAEDRWGGQTNWSKEWSGTDSIYGETILTTRAEVIGVYDLPGKENFSFQYSGNYHHQDSYYGKKPFEAWQSVGFVQLTWHKEYLRHKWLAGIPVRATFYDDNTPATLTSNGIRKLSFLPGAFVQQEWNVTENFIINPGARFDYHSVHGSIFTPRLAFKFNIKPNHILRLTSGTGYRVVNVFTEDHAALTGSRDVKITENLKPERNYNASLNYDASFFMKKFYVVSDVSVFYTYFSNKIIPDYASDVNLIVYQNLHGYATVNGANFNTAFNFSNGIRFSAGCTWLKASRVDKDSTGKNVVTPQLLTPKFSVVYSLTLPVDRWKTTLEITGKTYAPMSLPVFPNDFRSPQSPWFSLINLKIGKKTGSGSEVYIAAKNLLNFTPRDPVMRPFDPFDKHINENNPNGYTFDTTYNYASMQGFRIMFGFNWVPDWKK